jgi:hypothetical protein
VETRTREAANGRAASSLPGDEPVVAELRVPLGTPPGTPLGTPLGTPPGRGLGLCARLVEERLAFAREAGRRQVALRTDAVLVSARTIYRVFGFTLAEGGAPSQLGRDLVGQSWADPPARRGLKASGSSGGPTRCGRSGAGILLYEKLAGTALGQVITARSIPVRVAAGRELPVRASERRISLKN